VYYGYCEFDCQYSSVMDRQERFVTSETSNFSVAESLNGTHRKTVVLEPVQLLHFYIMRYYKNIYNEDLHQTLVVSIVL